MAATLPPEASALVDALGVAGGTLDDTGRRIALTTYRLLVRGHPVTNHDIAAAADISVDDVERHFAEWAGVFRNRDDAVVGFWGLALAALDPEYRLQAPDGGVLGYAWCAWDTLFLPTLLAQTLEVTATDELTGEPVRLTVTPDGVQAVDPAEAVVSFLAPDGAWDADIITSFCHKVIFFANRANAEAWIEQQPDRLFTLSVGDAFDIGRRWVDERYGDALIADPS